VTKVVNVAEVIDARRVGALQVRAFLLCAAVLFVDGFDVQGITYIAPAISQAWHLQRGALGRARIGVRAEDAPRVARDVRLERHLARRDRGRHGRGARGRDRCGPRSHGHVADHVRRRRRAAASARGRALLVAPRVYSLPRIAGGRSRSGAGATAAHRDRAGSGSRRRCPSDPDYGERRRPRERRRPLQRPARQGDRADLDSVLHEPVERLSRDQLVAHLAQRVGLHANASRGDHVDVSRRRPARHLCVRAADGSTRRSRDPDLRVPARGRWLLHVCDGARDAAVEHHAAADGDRLRRHRRPSRHHDARVDDLPRRDPLDRTGLGARHRARRLDRRPFGRRVHARDRPRREARVSRLRRAGPDRRRVHRAATMAAERANRTRARGPKLRAFGAKPALEIDNGAPPR
jgi:hypothetical protein